METEYHYSPNTSYVYLQDWVRAIAVPGLPQTSLLPWPRSWATWAHRPAIQSINWEDSKNDVGQTGLSSQSSPYSSIFANRSSTIGLMNSISCWICEGRFDSMRETMLKQYSVKRKHGRGSHRQLKRFRKQADDKAKLYCVDRES